MWLVYKDSEFKVSVISFYRKSSVELKSSFAKSMMRMQKFTVIINVNYTTSVTNNLGKY